MKSRMTEDTAALLGGALLGVAAMYLLDPEAGRRRREGITGATWHLPSRARAAVNSGTQTAGKWFDRAHDGYAQARDAARDHAADASHLADRARDGFSHLRDMGSHLWDRARGVVSHVPDMAAEHAQHARNEIASRTDDWRKRAAEHISRRSHQAQSWLGHEEHSGIGAGTILSSTAGCCAVGAGLMYFLDPQRGSARRSWVGNRTMECINRTGSAMRSIGDVISRRLLGAGQSAGRSRNRIDSGQLIQSIRSDLARLGLNVDQAQFMADGDGTVTVTGSVAADDVESVLTALHQIPGVDHVINRTVVNRSGGQGQASMPSSARL